MFLICKQEAKLSMWDTWTSLYRMISSREGMWWCLMEKIRLICRLRHLQIMYWLEVVRFQHKILIESEHKLLLVTSWLPNSSTCSPRESLKYLKYQLFTRTYVHQLHSFRFHAKINRKLNSLMSRAKGIHQAYSEGMVSKLCNQKEWRCPIKLKERSLIVIMRHKDQLNWRSIIFKDCKRIVQQLVLSLTKIQRFTFSFLVSKGWKLKRFARQ